MKKLLNLFSVITLTSITTLSLISCKAISGIKLTSEEEQKYILEAINANKKSSKGNDVTSENIMPKPDIIYLEQDNKQIKFVYHLGIYQNANTFLNVNHRITNLEGMFTLDYDNNRIIDNTNKMDVSYSLGDYDNYLENTTDALIGNSNDFTLIMNRDDWNQLAKYATDYHNKKSDISVNIYLQQLGIFNNDIVLQEDGTIDNWLKIVNLVMNNYLINNASNFIYLHIIKPINKDYEIAYNNLLNDKNEIYPKIFSFKDYKKYSDKLSIILSKDLLQEFNDVYNSFLKKEQYGLLNWNYNSLMFLLERNYYTNNNVEIRKIINCIMNSFKTNYSQIIDVINNINSYSGIEFLFNKRIEFLGSKLINVNYENRSVDAARFIKDHYDFQKLICVMKVVKGYYVKYIDNNDIKQTIYIAYNNNDSFNDYQNTKDDALRYFNSLPINVLNQYFIHSVSDNEWNIQYINNKGVSESIILKYDNVNAIFSLVK